MLAGGTICVRLLVATSITQRLCSALGLAALPFSAYAIFSPFGEIATPLALSVSGIRVIFTRMEGARRLRPRRFRPKGKLTLTRAKLAMIKPAVVLWRLIPLTTYSKVDTVETAAASLVERPGPAAVADAI